MPKGPITRSQAIAPFGVGAMIVVRDGTSLIAGGLDYWFRLSPGQGDSRDLDLSEFRVEEWRLQEQLGVSHFRLPPDYRRPRRGVRIPNSYLTLPFFRFPRWHFCPSCKQLFERTPYERNRIRCPECLAQRGKTRFLAQVPFVAMCDYGHLQDFPWREWVHRSAQPPCQGPMRLIATGTASLAGQKIRCECGAERTLASITEAAPDGSATYLSTNLATDGQEYLCRGLMPWLGPDTQQPCTRPLRGSLRSASNVYYAPLRSAIYLPRGTSDAPQTLIELLEAPTLSTLISLVTTSGGTVAPAILRSQQQALLHPYSDQQITAALAIVKAGAKTTLANPPIDEDHETAFRRAEFQLLRQPRDDQQLSVRQVERERYEPAFGEWFDRISLVDKLRETRAFTGFARIFPEGDFSLEDRISLLWRTSPKVDDWLPAYVVFGEGIFLEFAEARLRAWEQRLEVHDRVQPLVARYQGVQQERHLRERVISARSVLLHTFAHLLINRLTFECGYSSASLRERLFVSNNAAASMAGVLIYTAAGDAEGTLGGLVRMGKPGHLEPVIRRALETARWCSADPVCMEMGERGGQGPDACNLAACHACALVPETACEEFNRFLDRGLVVGTPENRSLGYFQS